MNAEQRKARVSARQLVLGLLATAAAWALLAAASAQASIVTVGSPLPASLTPQTITPSVTVINSTLPEAGANVTSPVSGTIVRWRITGAVGGPFKLRVLTPTGGTTYKGAGSSAPQTPSSTGTLTFSTNLPIHAGDTIGLDNANASGDMVGANVALPGANLLLWAPPLADAETRAASTPQPNAEVGFNADVATVPSNEYSFGKVKKNKSNGTATLAVNVPGPGTLSLTGKGIKAQRVGRGAVASKTVTAAGTVKLRIKAKGRAKKKLNKTGKAKVKAKVTYTPTGDLPGVPNTQTKRVKLVKKG